MPRLCAIIKGMKKVTVQSYAKLNLSLEIVGRKNGYHELDSLVTSIDLSDEIRLRSRRDNKVTLVMHGQGSETIDPGKNVALRAAEAFLEKYGTTGADIEIFKNIPMGGGLGGSSADSAGVLCGMAKLYSIEDEKGIKSLADTLGSDTGYMLCGGFARMTGRGEQVWRLPVSPRLYFLLVCPSSAVSTAECYSLYDEGGYDSLPGRTESCVQALLAGKYSDMGASFFNALCAPACRISPEIGEIIRELNSFCPLGCGMTGSGSCVFALFDTKEMCDYVRSRYRGKGRTWVVRTVDPSAENVGFFDKIRNPFYLSEEEINGAK